MGYKPKRWPSIVMGHRDAAADNTAMAQRKTNQLIDWILAGEITTGGIVSALRDINRHQLLALLALQAAGAEVDIS